MGRWFHNVHVRAQDAQPIVDAVARWLGAQGFEPVARSADADRTVLVSKPKNGWVTILDDGYQVSELARVATEGSERLAVEAYCEASAIVWLALHRGGHLAGGWGRAIEVAEGPSDGGEEDDALEQRAILREPSREDVDPLGVPGLDAGALSAAWRESVREVFPETALAVAAKALRLDVARVFEDRGFRGHTLRVRRTTASWTATFETGPMRLALHAHPPDALFVDRAFELQIGVVSGGGPGRGLDLRFAWRDAADRDLLALEKVVLRDGREVAIDADGVAHVDVAIAAALTEPPDLGRMTRREADRAADLQAAATTYLKLHGRTLREGRGTLEIAVAEARTEVDLRVLFQPYRPLRAAPAWEGPAHDRRFFEMHVQSARFATLSFAGGLAEAWAWSRPQLEVLDASRPWVLMLGSRVVAQERDRALAELDRLVGATAPLPWVSLHAPGTWFGNHGIAPSRAYEGEEPVLLLTLAEDPTSEEARLELTALCDRAMQTGVALSALMASWERSPRLDRTLWEDLTAPFTDALHFRSWHAERVRGVDKEGVWLSATHLARVRLDALPDHAELTPLRAADGALVAARIRIPRELPRSQLRPLEEALDAILPSADTVAAWDAAHPGRWR